MNQVVYRYIKHKNILFNNYFTNQFVLYNEYERLMRAEDIVCRELSQMFSSVLDGWDRG